MTLLDIEVRTAAGDATSLAAHVTGPTIVVLVRYYG
jgi:hypothetical protein